MDLFLAACEGIGLALAAGALAAAPGRTDALGMALAGAGAVAGAILFAAALDAADQTRWPGWPAGAVVALVSFAICVQIAAGARRRAEGDATTGLLIGLAALAVAGLSVLLEPVGLVALLGVLYLGVARRRQAATKYEGLRSLR